MTPYYADPWLTVYQGDARTVLAELPAESVHCVVTSPPYFGLRDYGTGSWIGGDPECAHRARIQPRAERPTGKLHGGFATVDAQDVGARAYRRSCPRCGAERVDDQIGLEGSPEEYVANLVGVFREVRRVLRKDGTLWANLGDAYNSGTSAKRRPSGNHGGNGYGKHGYWTNENITHRVNAPALKPKDLVGIPWRVAFALQADGWYLRSDIIWSKPNPMPESVTDRPTKSHEYLFLLSKSPRYYYDADAVREQAIYEGVTVKASNPDTAKNGQKGKYGATALGFTQHDTTVNGRNLRSVWNIATQPYPGAHFATFPRKLVEPCIKAGCPENGMVLDPFAGSGTTGMVAQSLSRRAVLIDLNADYLVQALNRNRDIPLGLVG